MKSWMRSWQVGGALLTVLCAGAASGRAGILAATIVQVQLAPESLAPQCTLTEGEHAISVQAYTHYSMVETYTMSNPPVRKAYQSFACGAAKSTIYYYEY